MLKKYILFIFYFLILNCFIFAGSNVFLDTNSKKSLILNGDVVNTVNGQSGDVVLSTSSITGFVKTSGDTMTGNLTTPNVISTYGVSASTANFNSVLLSTFSAAPAYKEGQIYWDTTDKTLAIQAGISDTTLQVGQEQYLRVRNNTGAIIQNGSVVYITGRIGNRPTIGLAVANSSTTAKVVGMVTEDIAINDDGFVTTSGLVRGINASAYTANQTLYLSSYTAGGYQATVPPVPNYSIKIGNVATAMVNGSIAIDLGLEETNHTTLNYLTAISSFTSLSNANFEDNVSIKYGITASTGVFTSTVTVRLINADASNGISITASPTTFNGDIVINTNGTSALISTNKGSSGSNNLYVGNGGQLSTSAFANSTFGIGAGNKLTSGQQNTYIGYQSGANSQASVGNTGVGVNALNVCVGSNSTGVGVNVLKSVTTSTRHVAVGGDAGAWQVVGNNDTFIGHGAGQYIHDGVTKSTSMSSAVLIGYDTRVSTITSDNEIVVGASATGNGSNTATFGNDSIIATYLKGRVISNKTNCPISTTQVLYSTNTISNASSNAVVVSSGGAVSLTTAQITAGTVGDYIEIWGSSDTDTITLVDGGVLKLNSNTSFTLGVDDVITFRYMPSGYWCEISRSNN